MVPTTVLVRVTTELLVKRALPLILKELTTGARLALCISGTQLFDKLRIINTGNRVDIRSLLHRILQYLAGLLTAYESDVHGGDGSPVISKKVRIGRGIDIERKD